MRWTGHVARMERGEAYTWLCCGNLKERNHLQDPGLDGKVIFRWRPRKWDVGLWTRLVWLRIGTSGGRALVSAVMNLQVP